MFKIGAILLLLVAVSYGQVGGYKDRPDLIDDQLIKDLTVYAAEEISQSNSNLYLKNLKVTGVQTQVVRGINYKIDFTAERVNGPTGSQTTCQVVVYVDLDGVKSLSQSQCQTSF